MNYLEQLARLWQRIPEQLPVKIKERGYMVSENHGNKDILITGMNPSFREGAVCQSGTFSFETILVDDKGDSYWSPVKNMLFSDSIDLRNKAAYWDLFCFRETEQSFLSKEILSRDGGISFIAEQLNITQHVIEEVITPKVIVVANKESAAYWGKLSDLGYIWMGYDLKYVGNVFCGELYRIEGLLGCKERISPEITDSKLKGTFVLLTSYMKSLPKEKRPTVDFLNTLLSYYCIEGKLQEYLNK